MKKTNISTQTASQSAQRSIRLKPVHMRKLCAIMDVKTRALFSKNYIIMPIFSLGFTFLMSVIYGKMAGDSAVPNGYVAALGMLMNISMMGIYCTAAGLAEEKEKNTLRTLMTSSVNGLEFFLGSFIPVVVMSEIVNILCVFIARFEMSPAQWGVYAAVTTTVTAISTVVGMVFGIFTKNQISASTVTTPAILVFMMVPMFSGISGTLEKISGFFFTGIAFNAMANINMGLPATDAKDIVILAAELVISVVLFLALYRKNGFER